MKLKLNLINYSSSCLSKPVKPVHLQITMKIFLIPLLTYSTRTNEVRSHVAASVYVRLSLRFQQKDLHLFSEDENG